MIATRLRVSIGCALIGGPAVLLLELMRRTGALDEVLTWADDVVGAALLTVAALYAMSNRPRAAAVLALAWAFAAGQLFMSFLGQLSQGGPDPSGQPSWLVASIKAVLLVAAATLAFSTIRQSLLANQEMGS